MCVFVKQSSDCLPGLVDTEGGFLNKARKGNHFAASNVEVYILSKVKINKAQNSFLFEYGASRFDTMSQ